MKSAADHNLEFAQLSAKVNLQVGDTVNKKQQYNNKDVKTQNTKSQKHTNKHTV